MANNDQLILQLKQEVEAKKALISKSKKFNPITNASLELDGIKYNLHTISKETILYLIAKVTSLQNGLNNHLPEETLILNGFSAKNWIDDLLCKYNVINTSIERNKLEILENRLHQLLSNDKKVEFELEQLTKDIRK